MTDDVMRPQNLDLSGLRSAFGTAGATLEFEESAVKNAVQACTDLIEVLKRIQNRLRNLQHVSGMDAFASARELSKGLGERADMETAHFGNAVAEHLTTARALRDSLELAARLYFETEHVNVESLHKVSANGQMPQLLDPGKSVEGQPHDFTTPILSQVTGQQAPEAPPTSDSTMPPLPFHVMSGSSSTPPAADSGDPSESDEGANSQVNFQ
ncbi:hypothetical protein [Gordonia sputi]|uniref:hypothetical protein n=1 Tax=Gordonia sputi TaxID=36823 RepID=UPI0020430827|nr:hypothetical protein [Gordonia sputi]MCM3898069.1 hypothetical protein [Gordonia sputi]